jgi:integrase
MSKQPDPGGYVFKRSGSPFYYARWWVDGREFTKSTQKRLKVEAEEVRLAMVAASKGTIDVEAAFTNLLTVLGKVPEPSKQEQLRRSFASRLLAGTRDKLPIAKAWTAWVESPNKQRTPKEATVNSYAGIWKRFERWAVVQGVVHLHELDRSHAGKYAEDLWATKVTPSTFNAHIKFLTHVFKVLETKADLTENVWSRITRKDKIRDQGRRNFTADELTTIMEASKGNMRLMIALGLFTGLRLGDVANLRWDEIENDRHSRNPGPRPGLIVVKPMKTSRLGKTVEIPIHASLKAMLAAHRQTTPGEYVFPEERAQYLQNPSNLTSVFQKFLEKCKIITVEEKDEKTRRRRSLVKVGFHSLRHSFVTLCAKGGAPMHVVQKLVGHGSPMLTSDVYTHLDTAQKQSAINPLPSFGLVNPASTDGADAADKGGARAGGSSNH